MKIFYLIINLVIFVYGQFAGDRCTLREDRSQGVCTPISKCKSALNAFSQGKQPQNCGYEGTVPIVCCKSTTPPPSKQRKPGDISKRKCIEYAKYVFDEELSPVGGSVVHRYYDCAIEVVTLVVGGVEAKIKEFPHMALIGYGDRPDVQWLCGGSLISENFILSAAHCVSERTYGDATWAKLGVLKADSDDYTKQEVQIIDRIYHPQYNFQSNYHDIALFKISRVELNTFTRPLCLNTKYDFQTRGAIATGWGKTGFTAEASNVLMKVKLDFYSQPNCSYTYRSETGTKKLLNGILDESQICAGSADHKDTCQGDSGGPLQIFHDESQDRLTDPKANASCMYDIVGITSFGKACGLGKNIPGVYTRVSNYIKWIEDTVWPQ